MSRRAKRRCRRFNSTEVLLLHLQMPLLLPLLLLLVPHRCRKTRWYQRLRTATRTLIRTLAASAEEGGYG